MMYHKGDTVKIIDNLSEDSYPSEKRGIRVSVTNGMRLHLAGTRHTISKINELYGAYELEGIADIVWSYLMFEDNSNIFNIAD